MDKASPETGSGTGGSANAEKPASAKKAKAAPPSFPPEPSQKVSGTSKSSSKQATDAGPKPAKAAEGEREAGSKAKSKQTGSKAAAREALAREPAPREPAPREAAPREASEPAAPIAEKQSESAAKGPESIEATPKSPPPDADKPPAASASQSLKMLLSMGPPPGPAPAPPASSASKSPSTSPPAAALPAGLPPAGPSDVAPVPEPEAESELPAPANVVVAVEKKQLAVEKKPQSKKQVIHVVSADSSIADPDGTISGGTGGTVDFMASLEKAQAVEWDAALEMPTSPKQKSPVRSPGKNSLEDDIGLSLRLEDMVEELAGVDSFDCWGDFENEGVQEHHVEDNAATAWFPEPSESSAEALSQVQDCTTHGNAATLSQLQDCVTKLHDTTAQLQDASRAFQDVLSKAANDSGLRLSAPAFVPGQMWTGSQRSSFLD